VINAKCGGCTTVTEFAQGEGKNEMFENSIGYVMEAMLNTEVVAKAKRKRFTAKEKLRILREIQACRGSGDIGALL
jgi:hypothetical protein